MIMNFWTFRQSIFMESVPPGRSTTSGSEEQSTDGCCRYNWAWKLDLLECGYWRSKQPWTKQIDFKKGMWLVNDWFMKTMQRTLDPEQIKRIYEDMNAWSLAHKSEDQSAALAFSCRRRLCWFLHRSHETWLLVAIQATTNLHSLGALSYRVFTKLLDFLEWS